MNEVKLSTLADRAILVRLTRSMYDPYAYDSQATQQIEVSSGVVGAGRYNKRLFRNCKPLEETTAAFGAAYRYFMANTVPWLDNGVRMLPSEMYFDFTAKMKELMDEARASARKLASQWGGLVAADVLRLGPLGNPSDYPRDIYGRFEIAMRFLPVPHVADFRVGMTEEDKATLHEAITEAEANVAKHLMGELLKPIQKAVEKLSVPIGAEGSIFRDTLMSNITEVATQAKRLNAITNDPTVAEIVRDIEARVSSYAANPDRLRESQDDRMAATAELDAIMSKMAGLF